MQNIVLLFNITLTFFRFVFMKYIMINKSFTSIIIRTFGVKIAMKCIKWINK